jgi:uncharacterized protein YecE (DUF72 family)
MKLYVGTSGYSYKEWKGSFYPEDIPAAKMLSYYAERLPAVELNNTYYRMPQPSTVESWRAQAPKNFRFSVKAPQSITLYRRLKDAGWQTKNMLETVSALGDRLGAVFFRMPEDMKKDLGRLEGFLKELPADTPVAFEFRHATWFDDDVVQLLRSHNRVLVVSDTDEMPTNQIVTTANWGYVRLRRVRYTKAELAAWSKRIMAQKWSKAFVFFKHEDEGTGPKLAAQFIKLNNPAA